MGDNDDFLSGLGDQDGEGDGEDDEEKEGENSEWAKSKKSLAIFLVDCSPSMLSKCEIKREEHAKIHLKAEDGDDKPSDVKYETRYSFALSEISKFCRNQVQKGSADRFGVVLFNVDDGKDSSKSTGVQVLVELNQPNVKFIKTLQQQASRSHLQNGLDECKKILYQQKEEMRDAKKAVYVLTWLDDPIGTEKGRELRKKNCLEAVGDCKDNGILVSVVPLAVFPDRDCVLPGVPPDSKGHRDRCFYVGNFYEDLARKAAPPTPPGGADAAGDVVQDLLERRIWHLEQEVMGVLNPRSIASLLWTVSDDPKLQIAVKLYPLTMEAKVKSTVWLDQRNNKRVKVMTQRVCRDTGTLLMESQIEKYFPYGRAEAVIDDKEMAKVKSLDIEQGIHLLGFKSRSSLRLEDNLKAPYFMYPDDKALPGSTLTFTAFWDSMLRQGRMAICTMRTRANVAPRLVALVPGREKKDPEGRVLSPDGLHVVSLPFCDDIRTIPVHPAADDPPDEAVDFAQRIIDHYQIESALFENPQLFRHFRHLEALSLEEAVDDAELEEVENTIMPDPEHYSDPSVVALFEGFKAAIDPDFDTIMAAGEGKGAGAKRKREPKPAAAPPDANLKDLCDSGGLKKLTVPQLKEHCKALGLTVGGNKADLVQRITDRCAKGD